MFEEGFVTDDKVEDLKVIYNQTVKKVTEDYESLNFNTAISQMMIFVNEVYKIRKISREYAEGFVKLLSPIAPHMMEEIWCEGLGHSETLAYESWPTYDEKALVQDTIELPVQFLGKMKGVINVPVNASQDEVVEIAKNTPEIAKFMTSEPKKIIYVAGRILNFIV
jgi:leucyl-tRNA synthetase